MTGAIRFCIGCKPRTNLGVVYDPDGTIIGKVEKRSRVAAGLKGARAPFYTALVALPSGETVGCSLGTRHPDRWSAARAIRTFHDAYPLVSRGYADRSGASAMATAFKRDRWRDCALPYRTIN